MMDAAGLWRGRTAIYAIAFLMDLCVGCAALGVILYADDLGASALKLGIVGATAFAYTVACLFTGRLSDVWGRKRVAGLGALVYAGVYLAITRVHTIPHLVLLAALGSGAVGFFWPPMQAWLGEQRDKRSLSRSLGIFNVCWSIGLVLGPVLTTWLRKLGAIAPFYFASATAVLILVMMLLTRRDGRTPEEVEPPAVAPRVAMTFLHVAWIANFASWFMSNSVKTLLPKLTRATSVPDTTLGWLVATVAIAQTVMFIATRFSDRWQYNLKPLVFFQALGATGMVIVALGNSPATWATGIAMAGLCAGMTYSASLFYSLHGRSAGHGARTGMHEAILGSGILMGPLAGGWAIDATGGNLHVPYILAAAVAAAALVAVVTLFALRTRAEAARAEVPEPRPTAGK